jgi:propionyl-CoA carboxylase alpha chain
VYSPTRAVRNDTGVFEGGEISIHYDPMIAKLCTWAPDRAQAIEAMRAALDGFEIEGIGHNLPFLSAVMDHPRFVSGEITTAFIAEEWPDGFAGVELPEDVLAELAAVAFALNLTEQRRAAQISGTLANHARKIGEHWVVRFGAREWRGALVEDATGSIIDFGGLRLEVNPIGRPPLVRARISGRERIVKVAPIAGGYRMRYRGADLKAQVLSPRHAELAALLPAKPPPDTSRLLLCPMPGLIVRIDVAAGDEVHDGQALCMVEAMKMENVLRAERKARVAAVRASPGDSLAVDDVIMEFE